MCGGVCVCLLACLPVCLGRGEFVCWCLSLVCLSTLVILLWRCGVWCGDVLFVCLFEGTTRTLPNRSWSLLSGRCSVVCGPWSVAGIFVRLATSDFDDPSPHLFSSRCRCGTQSSSFEFFRGALVLPSVVASANLGLELWSCPDSSTFLVFAFFAARSTPTRHRQPWYLAATGVASANSASP